MFWCFLVWQRAAPQSAEERISVILSKEARCFGVFWFGRGAPSLLLKKLFFNEKVAFLFCLPLWRFSQILIAWTQSLEKTLSRSALLPHVAFTLSKCHPAAAEGAKFSAMRRGKAQPCHQRRARSLITLRSKRNYKLKFI